MATLIVAAGCFWCVEAVYDPINGVERVESGYIGGAVDAPTYAQVCTGTTGHAEAVRISFDPDKISVATLYDVFFHTHDPTTLNRQGGDVGTQYRSALFPLDADQEQAARTALAVAQPDWPDPIVTRIEPAATFWPAEADHQAYYARVGDANPYCAAVVGPKLAKFRARYRALLRQG